MRGVQEAGPAAREAPSMEHRAMTGVETPSSFIRLCTSCATARCGSAHTGVTLQLPPYADSEVDVLYRSIRVKGKPWQSRGCGLKLYSAYTSPPGLTLQFISCFLRLLLQLARLARISKKPQGLTNDDFRVLLMSSCVTSLATSCLRVSTRLVTPAHDASRAASGAALAAAAPALLPPPPPLPAPCSESTWVARRLLDLPPT